MVLRAIHIFNKVRVASAASLASYTATALCLEVAQLGALDITHVADSDDHIVVRNEILLIEVAAKVVDLGLALVAKLLLDLCHLIANHLHTENVVGKD